MQHEHSSGAVFTHQCVYIDSITPVYSSLLIGKSDDGLCDPKLHEAYRSVLGGRLDRANEGRASRLCAGITTPGTRPQDHGL